MLTLTVLKKMLTARENGNHNTTASQSPKFYVQIQNSLICPHFVLHKFLLRHLKQVSISQKKNIREVSY